MLGELGRGAMGVVLRVRHRTLGVERALKLLKNRSSAQTVERFFRELDVLRRVVGPGVVAVHEAGVEDGCPYIVMPIMTGGSLRARLDARTILPWQEAVRIVSELARALDRCHRQGLVHRDLKPDNVLFDDEGRAYLADFGIARDLSARSLTQTGALVGTPTYAAPEQLEGSKVDGRADVYSLGVVLYELVTGRPPFEADSLPGLISAIENGRFARASELASVPRAFDSIIARAIAAKRERRVPSAAALARDLDRLLAGKDAPTRRFAVAGVGVALALLAAGSLAFSVTLHPEAPIPDPRPERPVEASRPAPSRTNAPAPVDSATGLAALAKARQLVMPLSLVLEADRAAVIVRQLIAPLGIAARAGVTDPEVGTRVRDVMVLCTHSLDQDERITVGRLIAAHDPSPRSRVNLASMLLRHAPPLRDETLALTGRLLGEAHLEPDVLVQACTLEGGIRLDRGENERALAVARRAYEVVSDDADTSILLTRAQLAVGAIDSALATTERSRNILPTEPGTQAEAFLHQLRGHTLLLVHGSAAEALSELEKARPVIRAQPGVHLDCARARIRLGRFAEARRDIDEALSFHADPAEARAVEAEIPR